MSFKFQALFLNAIVTRKSLKNHTLFDSTMSYDNSQ